MKRKGQNFMMIAALVVILFIFFIGFPLLFTAAFNVDIEEVSEEGLNELDIGDVSGGFTISGGGTGTVIEGQTGFIGGVMSQGSDSPQSTTGKLKFSSLTYSALQLPQTVLYSSTDNGGLKDTLIDFLYCEGRREDPGCRDTRSAEEIKKLLKSRMEEYLSNQDTAKYPYSIEIVKSGKTVLEVTNEQISSEAGSEGDSSEGRTIVNLPLAIPSGEEAEINFLMEEGNMKVISGYG
ncbi:MAG: hypothetical protein SVV03_02155 [Candidatus Nanohaloarchaea archaeon]|nr:hypothetical protein [Candidatus Nanohaloarchaea archaeon]